MSSVDEVKGHYETYPYPSYPLFVQGRWSDLARVDLKKWGVHSRSPTLWIAGCGTIAPLMFGRRNPSAQILATDLSQKSLRISRQRCFIYGIHNIEFMQEDLLTSTRENKFDAIDAYGVIHHTPEPARALEVLVQGLKPGGILRLMVYSADARASYERKRKEYLSKGLKLPEIETDLSKETEAKDFELSTKSGRADAFLHPLVHTYREEELRTLISKVSNVEIVSLENRWNFIVFLRRVFS